MRGCEWEALLLGQLVVVLVELRVGEPLFGNFADRGQRRVQGVSLFSGERATLLQQWSCNVQCGLGRRDDVGVQIVTITFNGFVDQAAALWPRWALLRRNLAAKELRAPALA